MPMVATLLTLLLTASPQEAPVAAPPAEPDVSLSITARANEIRWRQVGGVSVRAWSEPPGAAVEENLTTGLPHPIPARRTFRNVEWRLRAEATIATPAPRIEIEAGPASATPTPEGDPE